MKKNVITILLVLLTVNTFAQKIIETPSFEVTNSGINHISKIELNKEETRLHIHCKFIPNWWVNFQEDIFIKDCETGEKYTINKVEGFDFDEKVYMPESAEKTFVLVFPPLDKSIEKFDYNDEIFGVSLKKIRKKDNESKSVPKKVNKWIANELAKVTTPPLENYNSPNFFNRKNARLIGYIKGYDVRLGFKTGIIYMGNDITREDYPIVIQIHPDGRFEADIPLTNPIYSYVVFKRIPINVYLEPGKTLAMILNWEEFLYADRMRKKRHKFKDIVYKGPIAKVNEDFLGFNLKEFNYKSFSKKLKKISPEEFKEEETRSLEENMTNLLTYTQNSTISDKAKTLLKNNIDLDYAVHLFDFISKRKYEARKDTINEVLKIPVKDSYYNFLQNMNLNDKGLLVLSNFSTFVNRFEFCEPLSIYPKSKSFKPEISFLEYIDEANLVITDNDKKLMKEAKNKKFKSQKEYKDYMKLYSEVYKKGVKDYTEKYIQSHFKSEKISMEKWQLRDSVVKNVLHLEKNLVYDLVKIRALKYDIKRSNSENANEYWSELKKDIENPFLKEEGKRMVTKLFPIYKTSQKTIDGNQISMPNIKARVTKLPEGKGKEIFKNIVDQYKGKVLFIDFWATSCAPCVGGIKRMKDTREEYEGNKDFDFVFITDERSSPIKTYNKLVEEQELKNIFRLPVDDYNYLRQLFKFNGIPRYVVLDKNGDVINNDFPMHNFNNELDDILKDYK